jgi:hypothetical protein
MARHSKAGTKGTTTFNLPVRGHSKHAHGMARGKASKLNKFRTKNRGSNR